MQISVDFGFGFLKALSNDKQVIFPTAIGELQESTFQLSPNGTIGIITDDGAWLFGEDALLQSALTSRWQSSDWILRPEYKAGILAAITEMSQASRLEVELTLALPYQDARNYKDRIIFLLSGIHSVQRSGHNRQQLIVSFPERFPIIPQNIAPAFRHLLKENGTFQTPETSRALIHIGILNVGSHTVELGTASIRLPNSFSAVAAQCRTEQAGTYSLAQVIRPQLQAIFPDKKKYTDHEIFNSLKTGLVEVYNVNYDLPDKSIDSQMQYCRRIEGICSANWSDASPVPKSDLFAFVISGGGAHIVEPYLRSINYHPNLVVSDDPQWDVVEGVKRLRKMLK